MCKRTQKEVVGYVLNLEDISRTIEQFSSATGFKFIKLRTCPQFGMQHELNNVPKVSYRTKSPRPKSSSDHNVNLMPTVPFAHHPYRIYNKMLTLECHLAEYHTKYLEKKGNLQVKVPVPSGKRRQIFYKSKKLEKCPARITVREVLAYPKNIIRKNTAWCMRSMSKVINSERNFYTQKRFYIKFPTSHLHSHSSQRTMTNNPLSKEVSKFIQQLSSDGLTSLPGMKAAVNAYANKAFISASPLNNSYYPSNTSILNHIYRGWQKIIFDKEDQLNMYILVLKWRQKHPEDFFFWRALTVKQDEVEARLQVAHLSNAEKEFFNTQMSTEFKEEMTDNSVMFIHQSKQQMLLLQRYGDYCMMDATYKTTKYEIPLFLLGVKTNVGYSIVATFIVASEETSNIAEALSMIKTNMLRRGYTWQPTKFMTDKSVAENNAIRKVFPGTYFTFLIPFTATYLLSFIINVCSVRMLCL